MYYRKDFQRSVCIMATMIFVFPFSLCAEENKETVTSTESVNAAEKNKGVVEDETGVYYIIKKGDTLWSLSRQFLDSPWQWPGLWAENSDVPILNPHDIYPGQRIRLVPRKTPSKAELSEQFRLTGQEPEFDQSAQAMVKPEFSEPVQKKEVPYFAYPSIDRVGFLMKKPAKSSGSIFKAKDDKGMISKGDQVYIREAGTNALLVGRHYTVYRTMKPTEDEKTLISIGVQHFLTGIVEITEKKPRFAIGRVIQSFRDIALNDLLMPRIPRSPKITLAESVKGFEGKILASEDHAGIIGEHSVVFINKGEDDGVRSGQQYSIYYQEKAKLDPQSEEEILLPPVDFGKLIVLLTQKTTSTVLIIQSDKAIHSGTKIRSP